MCTLVTTYTRTSSHIEQHTVRVCTVLTVRVQESSMHLSFVMCMYLGINHLLEKRHAILLRNYHQAKAPVTDSTLLAGLLIFVVTKVCLYI